MGLLLREFVADFADGDEHVRSTDSSEFLAQVGNVHVHYPVHTREITFPDAVQEVIAGEHPTGRANQRLEQVKLQSGDCDFLISERDFPANRINPQAPVLNWSVMRTIRPVGSGAPEDGPDPGDKFSRAEWFRDVIISTQLQADNPVPLFTAGSQHYYRGVAFTAQSGEEPGPVTAGQHPVEHDQGGRFLQRARQAGVAVAGVSDSVPVPFEISADKLSGVRVIFDYENSAHASSYHPATSTG